METPSGARTTDRANRPRAPEMPPNITHPTLESNAGFTRPLGVVQNHNRPQPVIECPELIAN
jgi:hypothetical protein